MNKYSKTAYYNRIEVDPGVLKKIIEENTVEYTKNTVLVKPNCIFHINNNFKHNNDVEELKYKGFATSGTLMMIDGKPKSRKTTFAYMMAAAALNEYGIYENILCTMDPNNHIVIFDTEQTTSEFKDKMDLLKMWSQREDIHEIVKSYNLVKFGSDPEMKIQAINYFVRSLDAMYRKRDGSINPEDKIGLIIIDHVGDLVNNENNKEEVKELLGFFQQLADHTGALVLMIIHQNKNNNQATGMLGGDMAKKVSSHIKTFKKQSGEGEGDDDMDQSNPTEVVFADNRFGGKKPKRFIFNYDEYNYPVILDHKELHYNFSG